MEKLVMVDAIPDLTVHDNQVFCRQLYAELHPLLPDVELNLAINHNYCE